MKKIILNAMIIATSLFSLTTNADQIISMQKAEVKALNAALKAPVSVETLLKCDKETLLLLRNGVKIKRGNYAGSMYGIQYQLEIENAGRTETLIIRETYRDNNGSLLDSSTVECGIIK